MSGISEDESISASQETIMPSQTMDFERYNVSTDNVFAPLSDQWVGNNRQSNRQSDRQSEKRKRNRTGSVEMGSFQGKYLNEKLDIIYSKFIIMEESQNQVHVLHERVKR